jgi:hypothetical protein
LATVTGLLLRKAQAVRAGAQGDDDYDVIGTDGIVIGRIFKATTCGDTLDVDAGLRGSRGPLRLFLMFVRDGSTIEHGFTKMAEEHEQIAEMADPDVQISRFRFFMEEPRSRRCR